MRIPTLPRRPRELATKNRLRRGLAGFAERVFASLNELDVLTDDDTGTQREPQPPKPGPRPVKPYWTAKPRS
jgi:hypothetical protein